MVRGRRGSLRWMALLILVCALMGGLAPTASVAAPQDPPPRPLPADTSDGSDQTPLPVEADPGELSESEAMTQAKASGEPVVVSALTDEKTLVVANPSGDFTAELSAIPERVETPAGDWVAVDTSLEMASGGVEPAESPADVVVSAGGDGPLVTLTDGSRQLALSWPEPLPVPVLVGDRAVFVDVSAGVDLVVRTSPNGFNVYLVVRDRAAATSPVVAETRLGWSGVGLTLRESATGFEAVDDDGGVVFAAPSLAMWSAPDAAGENSPAGVSAAAVALQDTGVSAAVPFEVTDSELIIRPPAAVLNDPELEFPVVVDPSVAKFDESWAMVWSDGQTFWNSSTEEARVGLDGWTTGKKSRVFYSMAANLDGKVVSKATFSHRQIHSPRGACDSSSTVDPGVEVWRTSSISSSTSWSSQPAWSDKLDTAYVLHGHRDSCPGYTMTEWNVTAAARDAAAAGWATLTLGMRSTDEGDKYGWRRFDNVTDVSPKLVVVYNTKPVTPWDLLLSDQRDACGKAWAPSRTPVVSARLSDPDGDLVKARFYTDVAGVEKVMESDWVSSGSRVGVRSVSLPDGPYTFTAAATDGTLWSKRSEWVGFWVDETPPPAPVVSFSPATPKLGDQVTVTITGGTGGSGSSDVDGFLLGVNTSTPSTWVDTTAGKQVSKTFTVGKSGPNTVTVRAKDCAGNESGLTQREFKVDVLLPSDIYRLDGDGTDDRTSEVDAPWAAAPLTIPSGTVWAPGPEAEPDQYGTVSDPDDQAFDTRGGVKSLATSKQPLPSQGGFSITAWVKPTMVTPDSYGYGTAVGFSDADSSGVQLGWRCVDTVRKCYWVGTLAGPKSGGGEATVWVHDLATRDDFAQVAVGEWTHLALVWDGVESARMYVNGDLVATLTGVTIDPRMGDRIRVGKVPYAESTQFIGLIDHVELYPGPIDASLVSQSYVAKYRP